MKRIILIFTVLAMSIPAVAQVQAGGTASAVYYQGNWYMGTELTPLQVPVFYAGAAKNNIFSVGQRDVVVPGAPAGCPELMRGREVSSLPWRELPEFGRHGPRASRLYGVEIGGVAAHARMMIVRR